MVEQHHPLDFSQLETQSVYGEQPREFNRERRGTFPLIPDDGISTPRYDVPRENRGMNQIMLGIITPHPYNGESNPREWLAYFENVSEANAWNDDFKFKRLISCLKGSPLIWYQSEKLRNPTFNYAQFKKGLVEKFSNECDSFLSQINIMRRNQEPNETFNSYWHSKLSLIELTSPTMSVEEKITHLFNGLNQDLYKKVISKYITNKPNSLEEMYKIIKRVDDALAFTRSRASTSTTKERQKPLENFGQRRADKYEDWGRNRSSPRNDQFNRLLKSFEEIQNRLKKIEIGNRSSNINPQKKSVQFTDEPSENPQTNAKQFWRKQNFNREGPKPSHNENFERQGRPNQGQYRAPKDLASIQCWTCGEFGHYSNNCPTKEAKNEVNQN